MAVDASTCPAAVNERNSRTTLRPTVFGMVLMVLLGAAWVMRPEVADPSVTGMVFGGLTGALGLGVIWPAMMLRLVRIRVVDSPDDLIVGELASIEVRMNGLASGMSISVVGSAVTTTDLASPATELVPIALVARGVYRRVELEVGSDAPFGVMWATRRVGVDLPTPIYVGPVSDPNRVEPARVSGDTTRAESIRAHVLGETVRSVRPYVPGDPAHLVHWPTTARSGSLVVREFEPPTDEALAIVVDLGTLAVGGSDVDLEARESAARRAAGMAETALARGVRVVMCTSQEGGPVTSEVSDMTSARRHLAAAIAGEPGRAPVGWPSVVVAAAQARRAG